MLEEHDSYFQTFLWSDDIALTSPTTTTTLERVVQCFYVSLVRCELRWHRTRAMRRERKGHCEGNLRCFHTCRASTFTVASLSLRLFHFKTPWIFCTWSFQGFTVRLLWMKTDIYIYILFTYYFFFIIDQSADYFLY